MLTVCQSNTTPGKLVLWEFRGLTPYVQAGLVPAPCGATTRVARTPQNPQRTYWLFRNSWGAARCRGWPCACPAEGNHKGCPTDGINSLKSQRPLSFSNSLLEAGDLEAVKSIRGIFQGFHIFSQ